MQQEKNIDLGILVQNIDRLEKEGGKDRSELSSLYRQHSEITNQNEIIQRKQNVDLIRKLVAEGIMTPIELDKQERILDKLMGTSQLSEIVTETPIEVIVEKPVEIPVITENKVEEWPHGLTNYEILAFASHFEQITNSHKLYILNDFLKSTDLNDKDIELINDCLKEINNDSNNIFDFGQDETNKSKNNPDYLINSAKESLRKIKLIIDDNEAYDKLDKKNGSMGMLICAFGQINKPITFCDRNYKDVIEFFEKLVKANCGILHSVDDNKENGSVAIDQTLGIIVCTELNYNSANFEIVTEQKEIINNVPEEVSEQPQTDKIGENIIEVNNSLAEKSRIKIAEIKAKEEREEIYNRLFDEYYNDFKTLDPITGAQLTRIYHYINETYCKKFNISNTKSINIETVVFLRYCKLSKKGNNMNARGQKDIMNEIKVSLFG